MAFSAKSLNKFNQWSFIPDYSFDNPDNYHKPAELYAENGPDCVYVIRGAFIGTRSKFVNKISKKRESPVLILDEFLVNAPENQIEEIRELIENPEAHDAVDGELVGFTIRQYHNSTYNKDCYAIDFCDL